MREVKVEHIAFTLGKDDERVLQGNKVQELAAQNFKKIKEKEREKKRTDQGSCSVKENLRTEITVF